MASRYLYLFWGAMPLIVVIVADRLGIGTGRVGFWFKAVAVPATVTQLYFLPRTEIAPAVATLLSAAVGGVVTGTYLAACPLARSRVGGLSAILAVMTVEGLVLVYVSGAAGLSVFGYMALLTAVVFGTTLLGPWIVNRISSARRATNS